MLPPGNQGIKLGKIALKLCHSFDRIEYFRIFTNIHFLT